MVTAFIVFNKVGSPCIDGVLAVTVAVDQFGALARIRAFRRVTGIATSPPSNTARESQQSVHGRGADLPQRAARGADCGGSRAGCTASVRS
ncbi:hypothetical protein QJS66_15195 [Kocuria rhizophila]|nr:hypothetical protein QJS66_15195 [Kocuria rhizophila]